MLIPLFPLPPSFLSPSSLPIPRPPFPPPSYYLISFFLFILSHVIIFYFCFNSFSTVLLWLFIRIPSLILHEGVSDIYANAGYGDGSGSRGIYEDGRGGNNCTRP